MTGFELIKFNKARYAEIEKEVSEMPEGLAKEVKQEMILAWVMGNKWLGGLSDAKANRLIEKIARHGYEIEDIIDEYENQMMAYVKTWN